MRARYQSFDNPNSTTPNVGHIRLDVESVYHGNLWLAADFAQYRVDGAAEVFDGQADSRVQYLGSARDSKWVKTDCLQQPIVIVLSSND